MLAETEISSKNGHSPEQGRVASAAQGDVRAGFARAEDGVELYWRTVGSGPLLVCCNGVGVSTFFWKYVTKHFRDRFTIVVWDYRGHGRSERSLDPHQADMSVGRHAEDLEHVLTALDRVEPALVVGHSMGCQVALEHCRRYPERVRALVLMLGTAGRALETFFDFKHSPVLFKAIHRALFRIGIHANEVVRPLLVSPLAWKVATRFSLVDPIYTRREDLLPYMAHLASLDLRLFIESVIQIDNHDAWDLLPELDRPLLVIAAENDKFTPMWCAKKMVDDTPGAELLVLADASHAALIEQPETINCRLDRFIRERLH